MECEQAANYLNCSIDELLGLVQAKKLTFVFLRRMVRFRRSDLDQYRRDLERSNDECEERCNA